MVNMNDQDNKKEQELSTFVADNQLPCFAQVIIEESDLRDENYDIVYLFKVFEADCLFAKCYSNILQSYLLHHRPSYVPSETDLTLHLTQGQNIQYLFSDIISIPYNYNGLFEVFSSNSIKSDGILDHEKDIASLVGRIRKPKLYYVAKEMRAYEIAPDKRGDDITGLSRKWSKINKGSVVKVIRVVSIDYDDSSNACWRFLKKILCCNTITKKTDTAIELKVIENFEEILEEKSIIHDSSDFNNLNQKEFESKSHARLSRANLVEKTIYLPVYESSGSNEEIDLIPISSIIKNQRLKTNSLQLAKNFALNSQLKDNFIELKLFEENPFKPKSILTVQQNELIQENQHLEMEKYMSIYDLVDYRRDCKMIAGFSFNKRSLIFLPLEQIDIGLNKKSLFKKIDNNEEIDIFNSNFYQKFITTVESEIQFFSERLNKIETFTFKKRNFEGLKMNEIKKFKAGIKNTLSITHFADLMNADNTSNKLEGELSRSQSIRSSKHRLSNSARKYSTLPKSHGQNETNNNDKVNSDKQNKLENAIQIENEKEKDKEKEDDKNDDKIFKPNSQERRSFSMKRDSKSCSLPKNFKKFLQNSKIQDNVVSL